MKNWIESVGNWFRALFSETVASAWWVFSACSNLTTFFVHRLSGYPRLVSGVSAILGFAWANFAVYRKQEALIAESRRSKTLEEARQSELKITSDNGRYILVPVTNDVRSGDFRAMWLEFQLMIENVGRRDSTVSAFEVEIADLQRSCKNLKPVEGQKSVQGRHATQGLSPDRVLSKTGIIRVPFENATDHGMLLFNILGIDVATFANAGLTMDQNRRFPTLHCKLTITDTTGSSASAEFELGES
jgi:hypothetical protein